APTRKQRQGLARISVLSVQDVLPTGSGRVSGLWVAERKLDAAFVEHFVTQGLSEERITSTLRALAASEALMGQEVRKARTKLQSAIEALDAKVQRWVDAFEQGADPEVLGTERLRALKEERAQLVTQLHDTPEPRPLPPYVFK